MRFAPSRLIFYLLFLLFLSSSAFAAPGVVGRARSKVPGQYIVTLKAGSQSPRSTAQRLLAVHGGTLITDYSIVRAFAIHATDAQALSLTLEPEVAFVEEDAILTVASGSQSGLTTVTNPNATPPLDEVAKWGIDRLDQTSPTANRIDGTYTWCNEGAGVYIYLVDTGVLPSHPSLAGRVITPDLTQWFASRGFPSLGPNCWELTQSDYQYRYRANASHGTSVASLAAGNTFGVARSAQVIDVRTMDCLFGGASLSRVLAALEWIEQDHSSRPGRKVVNLSFTSELLYAPEASAIRDAIARLVDSTPGVPVIAAAGNTNDNAYWYVPANAPRAITVGAVAKSSDVKWSYSNYGYTTLFYAPGQFVEAASIKIPQVDPVVTREYVRSELDDCSAGSDTCTSGTSFATAHMTGVVARYLQNQPTATRDQIVSALQGIAQTYSGATVYEPATGAYVPVLVYNDCP